MTGRKKVLLRAENIQLEYFLGKGMSRKEKFSAINNITLELYAGETFGIIGRNGAGKSTLLSVLAKILEPDKGKVLHYGNRVALMTLATGFRHDLTGRENVILSGMIMGLSKKEILKKIPYIHTYSQLGDFFDEPFGNYSSGMRARLSFSLAVHAVADVLLIDEILGVGDMEFKRRSSNRIKKMISSSKSVVLVSHNIKTVKDLCQRVAWVENGTIVKMGETSAVLSAYQKHFGMNNNNQKTVRPALRPR